MFIYLSPRCFLPSFKSIGLSFREKKRKINSQDGGHGGHLGFPIGTILAFFFYLHVTRCFLPSFKSVGVLVQEKKRKIDFQESSHCGRLGFSIGTILAIINLQVTPMLPTKFQVSWPFGSGEEAKHRFSRWRPWRLSLISDQNDFSFFFYLQVTPTLPIKFQDNWPFGSGEEAKNRFSRWRPWRPS